MRFTEFFQTIPSFALAIVLVAILQPSIDSIVLAIALVSWPPVARLVRGEVLSLRSREYVQAAVTLGQTTPRIIFTQILPNTHRADHRHGLADGRDRDPARILALLPRPRRSEPDDLGLHGRRRPHAPASTPGGSRFFPGLAIFLTVLALNLVGEGLNDALNPRLARER